jgi:hypothetical protein
MSRNLTPLVARVALLFGGSLISAGLSAAADPKDPPTAQSQRELRDDEVLKELGRLGATVRDQKSSGGQPDTVQIELSGEWHGTSGDLKLLKRVPNLERLRILGVPIADDDLKQFDGLTRLVRVDLFGTKVTSDGVARLTKMYPGIKIDRRGNALLGIAGQADPAGCRVTLVQSKSAADDTGLRANDVITKFGGHEVSNFETLTTLIGDRDSGDKVTIELKRGEEVLKKEVKLGAWK